MVSAALLERDEALREAHESLTAAQTAVAEKEAALASAQGQLQQDHATLEGVRSWQSQAKEKAKEAERLGTDPRWGSSSVRRKARASRRILSSSRSGLPSRRPRPPSSANARPGRKRKAMFSGSAPRLKRRSHHQAPGRGGHAALQ
jgi:hypothetical protein